MIITIIYPDGREEVHKNCKSLVIDRQEITFTKGKSNVRHRSSFWIHKEVIVRDDK